MKIFLIGDYYSGTGPANVTLRYKDLIPGVIIQKTRNKAVRAFELLIKIMGCDVILMSGYSKQNVLSLKLARLFHKKSAYLMHGCVEHENAINGVPDEDMNRTERTVMQKSDAIYAVSSQFAEWLKNNYPEYKDKIYAAQNGLDKPAVSDAKIARKPFQLITIGGGMPRKMIKYIAEAVMLLREEEEYYDLRLVVVGDKGLDTEAVNSYSCVSNLGLVDYETCMRLLDQSTLFIQNSCFETFGLAPVEALAHGDSVLMSKYIGALELFSHVEETDVISDYTDVNEIAGKIRQLLVCGNNERLMSSLDLESYSWEERARQLVRMLENLVTE